MNSLQFKKEEDGITLSFDSLLSFKITEGELYTLFNCIREKRVSCDVLNFITERNYHIRMKRLEVYDMLYLIFSVTFKDSSLSELFIVHIKDEDMLLFTMLSLLPPLLLDKHLLTLLHSHYNYMTEQLETLIDKKEEYIKQCEQAKQDILK